MQQSFSSNGGPLLEIVKQIGNGQFSNVYQARLLKSGSKQCQQTAFAQCFSAQNYVQCNQVGSRDVFLTPPQQATTAATNLVSQQTINNHYDSRRHSNIEAFSNNQSLLLNQQQQENVKQGVDGEDDEEENSDSVDVALKHIKLIDIHDAKLREDCLKEVYLLQQLKHPNIINCIHSFIQRNDLYIVLELADGGDLCKLINYFARHNRLIIERTILKYFIQICSAVEYIHSKRILHRDIKPANIFMTSKGVVKLGDFGLGRFFSNKTFDAHSLVGTFYYMSPERINRTGYEFKSDIWSLGCVLYELITLNSPFSKFNLAPNLQQQHQQQQQSQSINLGWLIQRICNADYPSLSSYDNVSQQIKLLARDCLMPNPDKRPNITYIHEVVKEAYSVACALSSSDSK